MSVDRNLLSEFAKITNDTQANTQTQLYGTVVTQGDKKYVKMDGSDIITPIISTTDIKDGERVMVSINNHIATVTGNITNPSAGGDRVTYTEDKVDKFDHLFAGNITAENIAANSITADKILAGSITADKILAGSITAEKIATGTITAGSGIIADGAIGSAQISKIDAAKIEAGTIDTSKVTIQGSNGHLRLKGNRMQVFDGVGTQAKERVSVGDINGDGSIFGLRVRGADGQTILLDENGVKSEGITDGSITNDKISEDANIDGAKLNINSVVSKINEDGTETIQGTKIEVDGTNLNTKLSSITIKQDENGEKITQAQSQITANTNAIKLKVDEQTYITDKKDMTSKLEKNTSEISTMKGQIALKVEHTDIENAKSELEGAMNSKINSAKSEIKITTDSISQSVSNLSQTVSSSSSTIKQLSNQISSKVNTNDLSTIVKQNATSWGLSINGKLSGTNYNFDGANFSIGTTSGTNKAYHAATYSRWNHSDGSYTQASSGGLVRYTSGTGRSYHYLMHTGTVQCRTTVTVALPSHISGKVGTNYTVAISARGYGFDDWGSTALQQLYMIVKSKTSTNFVIETTLYGLKVNNNTQTIGGWVNIDYTIIA